MDTILVIKKFNSHFFLDYCDFTCLEVSQEQLVNDRKIDALYPIALPQFHFLKHLKWYLKMCQSNHLILSTLKATTLTLSNIGWNQQFSLWTTPNGSQQLWLHRHSFILAMFSAWYKSSFCFCSHKYRNTCREQSLHLCNWKSGLGLLWRNSSLTLQLFDLLV